MQLLLVTDVMQLIFKIKTFKDRRFIDLLEFVLPS